MPRTFRPFLIAVVALTVSGFAVVGLTSPKAVSADAFTFRQVSVGYHRACAVTTSGEGLCWGWNHNGSLGTIDTSTTVPSPSLVRLPGGQRFVSIDVGQHFMSCGLVAAHGSSATSVICWGEGGGRGDIVFPEGVRPTSLSVGATHACSIASDNDLYCWGGSTDDAVGVGPREPGPANIAQRVPLPADVQPQHVSAGIGFTCVATSGDAFCWGGNGEGQLGNGTTTSTNLPVAVRMPTSARLVSVSAGLERGCGIDATGNGWCWGRNYAGALGDDTYANSHLPRPIAAPAGVSFATVDTGWYHTCAATTSGSALCWGDNGNGQLATDNTYGGKTLRPVAISPDDRVAMIDAGLAVTCLIDGSGVTRCAGVNYRGNLGRGQTSTSTLLEPTLAVGTPGFSIPTAGPVSTHSASLSTTVASFGAPTTVSVEYSLDPGFASPARLQIPTPTSRRATPPSLADRVVKADLVGLQPRTTYFARFVGINTFGTNSSAITTFTTRGNAPTIHGAEATNVTGHSFGLEVAVHPHELPTMVTVFVSTSPDFTESRSVSVGPVAGTDPVTISALVDDLDARTTHHVRVHVSNELGSSTMTADPVDTVGELPSIGMTNATGARQSAVVTADVVTNTTRVTTYVEYGSEPGALRQSPPLTTTTDSRLIFDLTGLDAATEYVYRVVVSNNLGTVRSDFASFHTDGGPPLVEAHPPTHVTSRSATFSVSVAGNEARTFVKAQISDDAEFSSYDEQFLGHVGSADVATLSLSLKDLTPRRTTYVRFVATNDFGSTTSTPTNATTRREIGIHINDGDESTSDSEVMIHLEAPEGAVAVALSNDSSFVPQRVFDTLSSPIAWNLAPASGKIPSSVYARFIRWDGTVISTSSDSILYAPVDGDISAARPAPEPTSTATPVAGTVGTRSASKRATVNASARKSSAKKSKKVSAKKASAKKVRTQVNRMAKRVR